MGIVDASEIVKASVDGTFVKAYSRRGRKGGISDRGVRVGRLKGEAIGLVRESTQ